MRARWLLSILVLVFYLLHQDVWFWRQARPLVFGVLPVGLFYHACYTLAVSVLIWVLIRYAWPAHLDPDQSDISRRGHAVPHARRVRARARGLP